MWIVQAKFRNRDELLERFLTDTENGGFFLPTRRVLEPGTRVLVDVRLPELRDHLYLRGRVAYRQRGRRNEGVRAGLGIEFLPDEKDRKDYLLALARGEVVAASAKRKHKRLPTEINVRWRVLAAREHHQARVSDIGAGGAFLGCKAPPSEGTAIILEVTPPGGARPHSIEGRVAWQSADGVGIEFRCRDIVGKRRLRELIRRIEESVNSGA